MRITDQIPLIIINIKLMRIMTVITIEISCEGSRTHLFCWSPNKKILSWTQAWGQMSFIAYWYALSGWVGRVQIGIGNCGFWQILVGLVSLVRCAGCSSENWQILSRIRPQLSPSFSSLHIKLLTIQINPLLGSTEYWISKQKLFVFDQRTRAPHHRAAFTIEFSQSLNGGEVFKILNFEF